MTKIYEGFAALLIGIATVALCAVRFGFSDWRPWTPSRMVMLFFGIVCLIAAPVYFIIGIRSRHDRPDPREQER